MSSRFVVVGLGIAGLTAARTMREHAPDAEIILLTDEAFSFYSRPGLAYHLTGVIPETQLFPLKQTNLQQLGLKIHQARVEGIDPRQHSLRLVNGEHLRYDRLLLATGSSAVKPATPGMDLDGVVTLDTLEDSRRIIKLTRRAKRAVVIGGGITAVELAEGLTARGVETHYLMRGDRYWKNVLDRAEIRFNPARYAGGRDPNPHPAQHRAGVRHARTGKGCLDEQG